MIESCELVIKQPGHADRVVRLQNGATRLGRAEDNEVVLSDVGVSRRHAQVYLSRADVTVEDLGSGNGTYYNGYRVQSQPVQDGDEIVIDPFVLQFRIRGQTRATPPAAQYGGGAPPLARPPAPGARLEVVVGTGLAGSSYPIDADRGLSIGRSEDREVVIPDPAASRHHCQISLLGNDYVLRDMGSANGVFVNAVRVRDCTLSDGDLVRIGNTEMRFVRAGAPPSGRPPGWNEPAPLPSGVSTVAAPVRRNQRRPMLTALFGALLAFVAFLMVLVLVLAGVVVVLQMQPKGPEVYAARLPEWKLDLPETLDDAFSDELFEQGRRRMQDRDHKGALEDFYRILTIEPGHMHADKFAFFAGETLVIDTLEQEFERRAAEELARTNERDGLIRRATSSRSRSDRTKAQNLLKRKFEDDPVVMEAMDWRAPDDVLEIVKRAAEANDLAADGEYAEASEILAEVLAASDNPKTRSRALASLKLAQKELARETTAKWAEAVMLEAAGKRAEAKVLFQELAQDYRTLPSAPAHLQRM